MKTYTLDVLTPADEEMVAAILEALSKRNVIRFAVAAPWQPNSEEELAAKIAAADAQPRLSFAEARQRLGI
ncbi:MAG TPA: hypothetical protein VF629_11640 [Hymenobacter sp.]|jgi:hypothetical protein|uniref:hypothetical protein n=1 Tax=Hymenobacter sp. TaxID=1898978 RepID=UPI002EDA5C46